MAQDWAEQRHRSPESTAATLNSDNDNPPIGASELRHRLARLFFGVLWERPDRRKRWALRHRNEAAVHEVADELAWNVAADTEGIISPYDLAATVRYAFLDELAYGKELDEATGDTGPTTFYGIVTPVAKMLDWLIGHHPLAAHHVIGEIIGDAERRLEIPRDVTAESIRTALGLDSQLPRQTRLEFLKRVLPPAPHR
ncbi:hypothetical protein ACFYWX_40455 [Streptomyces sp. NPDC002888]|uniref:hypothetical protein n=1 Tax=Streptomyces sp. NPDC002888 TaxID=3364668 RepID=UPI0036A64D92